MIGIGFAPHAAPTARTAFGLPIFLAIHAYERVSPRGMASMACQTFCWNGVPEERLSRYLKRTGLPARYALSCGASFAGKTPAMRQSTRSEPTLVLTVTAPLPR